MMIHLPPPLMVNRGLFFLASLRRAGKPRVRDLLRGVSHRHRGSENLARSETEVLVGIAVFLTHVHAGGRGERWNWGKRRRRGRGKRRRGGGGQRWEEEEKMNNARFMLEEVFAV